MRCSLRAVLVLSLSATLGAQAPMPADQGQDTTLNLSAYAELLRRDVGP